MSLKSRRSADRREQKARAELRAARTAQEQAEAELPALAPGTFRYGLDGKPIVGPPFQPAPEVTMEQWKKWFLYSKRFWLIIAPIFAELIVRLGYALHLIPQGVEETIRQDVAQIVLRVFEALGAYFIFKGGQPLTFSYKASGGVPEAPFHVS